MRIESKMKMQELVGEYSKYKEELTKKEMRTEIKREVRWMSVPMKEKVEVFKKVIKKIYK